MGEGQVSEEEVTQVIVACEWVSDLCSVTVCFWVNASVPAPSEENVAAIVPIGMFAVPLKSIFVYP